MHKICGLVAGLHNSEADCRCPGSCPNGDNRHRNRDASAPYTDWTNELGRFSIDVPEAPTWEVQAKILADHLLRLETAETRSGSDPGGRSHLIPSRSSSFDQGVRNAGSVPLTGHQSGVRSCS